MDRWILTSIHKPNVLLKEKKQKYRQKSDISFKSIYNWILVNVEQQYFLREHRNKFTKETLVLPRLIFKHLEN